MAWRPRHSAVAETRRDNLIYAQVLGSRQYAPIVFAASDEEAERAAAWIAQGGKRDDGLERRQFAVETTDTFWVAEGYHQEYWQKRAAAS